jgi:hypothetical protein
MTVSVLSRTFERAIATSVLLALLGWATGGNWCGYYATL